MEEIIYQSLKTENGSAPRRTLNRQAYRKPSVSALWRPVGRGSRPFSRSLTDSRINAPMAKMSSDVSAPNAPLATWLNCPRTADDCAAASRLRVQDNKKGPWIFDQDISIWQNKGPFPTGHDRR